MNTLYPDTKKGRREIILERPYLYALSSISITQECWDI